MDSKGLRVKRILIVFALIGLVFSVSASKATVTQSVSVLYTALNQYPTTVEHEVPSGNYTSAYKITILPMFTWNATTSNAAFQLNFFNASGTYPNFGIQLIDTQMMSCIYNGSIVDIIQWTMDTEITIRVSDDGFTIHNGTDIQVEFYADFTMPIDGVHVLGLLAYVATAGTIILEFNDGGDFGIDIITDMIPLIVTVAVLGAVLKAFGKFKL